MKNNTIPKTIHYCWFGNNQKSELIKKCINSWKKMCPDYEIIEWNENNFDLSVNQYALEAYKEKKWAFVSDYVRLKIIYEYGGIYLDTDVELLSNLDDYINCNGFFSSEDNSTISTGLGFGAIKGNKLVKQMLDDYENLSFILPNGKINDEACPIRNSRSISNILDKLENRNDICIYNNNYFYPKEYFCPIDNTTGEIIITKKTMAIHHYDGSWLNKKDLRIKNNKRRICKIFGNRIGTKICKVYTFPHRVSKKIKLNGFKNTIKFAIDKIRKKNNKEV